jgi:hypothetical protein
MFSKSDPPPDLNKKIEDLKSKLLYIKVNEFSNDDLELISENGLSSTSGLSPVGLPQTDTSLELQQIEDQPIKVEITPEEQIQINYLENVLDNGIPDVVNEIDKQIKTLSLPERDTFFNLSKNYSKINRLQINGLLDSIRLNQPCDIITPTNVGTIEKYYKVNIQNFKKVSMNTQFIFVQGVDVFDIGKSVYSHNSIVQVASQYNFLESKTSNYSDISSYFTDRSQGPYASLSCLYALFLRDYLFRPNPPSPFSSRGSICTSQTIFDEFNEKDVSPIYRNGYLELFKLTDEKLQSLNDMIDHNNLIQNLNIL